MNYPHNIYIHVPFCMSKCKYCAFYSNAILNPNWQKYSDDICGELQFWAEKLCHCSVPTIFFGGGTPSLMPVSIFEQIMNCIYKNFDVDKDCEITMESNPGTLTVEKLKDFVSNGVNRLSVGVQSLKDKELEFLGRKHNAKQALDLLNVAQNMNLRLSGDFIYGLPGHNVQSVIDLCKSINNLGLKHVSLYELTIEENTPFGKMNLQMPTNENMANMYTAIPEFLSLLRYEVSNYSTPDEQCRHNKNVWMGDAYVGIGRGAAGRVYINDVWYEQRGANEKFEKLSNETRAIEKIITGIRTISGVMLSNDVTQKINNDWVKSHPELVIQSDNYLRATDRGMLILDDIVLDLIK